MRTRRRDFLIGAAAATTVLPGVTKAWAQARDDEKRSRVALMMFGLALRMLASLW